MEEPKTYEWTCPECKRTLISSYRIYKCSKCGYEPPIEYNKETFDELMERYEEHRINAAGCIRVISRVKDMYERKCRILTVVNILLIAIITGLLLWLR